MTASLVGPTFASLRLGLLRMPSRLSSGNRMLAEGALAAGCRFFAGYPITPASEIYEVMMRELPVQGGLALSAPDEISSLCYCVGASLRGLKAMTATSGPGWSLMNETAQYALMTETPVVVALVQRLGPSTGGATQGAQGDIGLAEFATSGGYTLPVFCPSNAAEAYELTVHAFNWAERLRTPVLLLSDKEVGMTTEVVDDEALQIPNLVNRKVAAANADLLSHDRYSSGLIDFQTVLQTQRTLLTAQDSVASARADIGADHVRLYKALGGGWNPGIIDAPAAGGAGVARSFS